MKIKIELTKTEVSKIRKTLENVSKQIYKISDQEYTASDKKEFSEIMDTIFVNGSNKNHYCKYKSNSTEKGSSEINIELTSKFITDLMNICNIFYVGIAKFVINIKKPFYDFVNKYFI